MTQPIISVLLPTVRPGLALRALSSLSAAACDVPFEVVVVADFPSSTFDIPVHDVQWIQRPRAGVIDAMNVAEAAARGWYLFAFNDESMMDPGSLCILLREARRTPREILTPRHEPGYTFVYYGIPFAPFPFASRELLSELGGMLDPAYKAFYADPDLSLRAHAAGVPTRTIDEVAIHHHNGQDEAKAYSLAHYRAADQATFMARWAHLGEFRDC